MMEQGLVASLSDQQQQQQPSRSKKRKDRTYDPNEERLLEASIFDTRPVKSLLDIGHLDRDATLVAINVNSKKNSNEIDNQLFVVDRSGEITTEDDKIEEKSVDESEDSKPAVWYDEDDEIEMQKAFENCSKLPKIFKSNDKYQKYLEKKFTTIYQPPKWATKKLEKNDHRESSAESDTEIERTAFNEITTERSDRKDIISLKKCPHLTVNSRVRIPLNSVEFHPSSTVALIGSSTGLVRLFQVDGKLNSLVQSIFFQGFRLTDASFISSDGREEIFVGSDGSNPRCHGFCYYYDMIAGRIIRVNLSKGGRHRYSLRGFRISPDSRLIAACSENGHINILTANSKELINELKINGECLSLAFSPDSRYLLAHGNIGQAYIFDVRNTRMPCVNRFTDTDAIVATSTAISPIGDLVAIGSNTGVVSLYQFDGILKRKKSIEPIKSIMNLTTAITSMKFNHDGKFLLMASNQKNDSVRFFNTESMMVIKNFPLSSMNHHGRTLGRIQAVDISPNSGFVTLATGGGIGHLFRLNNYSNY